MIINDFQIFQLGLIAVRNDFQIFELGLIAVQITFSNLFWKLCYFRKYRCSVIIYNAKSRFRIRFFENREISKISRTFTGARFFHAMIFFSVAFSPTTARSCRCLFSRETLFPKLWAKKSSTRWGKIKQGPFWDNIRLTLSAQNFSHIFYIWKQLRNFNFIKRISPFFTKR